MSANRKDFHESTYMSFLIKGWRTILKKHDEIWEKVQNLIKNEFDSETVYNGKYLKAKANSFTGKTNANFNNN